MSWNPTCGTYTEDDPASKSGICVFDDDVVDWLESYLDSCGEEWNAPVIDENGVLVSQGRMRRRSSRQSRNSASRSRACMSTRTTGCEGRPATTGRPFFLPPFVGRSYFCIKHGAERVAPPERPRRHTRMYDEIKQDGNHIDRVWETYVLVGRVVVGGDQYSTTMVLDEDDYERFKEDPEAGVKRLVGTSLVLGDDGGFESVALVHSRSTESYTWDDDANPDVLPEMMDDYEYASEELERVVLTAA